MLIKLVYVAIGYLIGTIVHILSYQHKYDELIRMCDKADRLIKVLKSLEEARGKDAKREG